MSREASITATAVGPSKLALQAHPNSIPLVSTKLSQWYGLSQGSLLRINFIILAEWNRDCSAGVVIDSTGHASSFRGDVPQGERLYCLP